MPITIWSQRARFGAANLSLAAPELHRVALVNTALAGEQEQILAAQGGSSFRDLGAGFLGDFSEIASSRNLSDKLRHLDALALTVRKEISTARNWFASAGGDSL